MAVGMMIPNTRDIRVAIACGILTVVVADEIWGLMLEPLCCTGNGSNSIFGPDHTTLPSGLQGLNGKKCRKKVAITAPSVPTKQPGLLSEVGKVHARCNNARTSISDTYHCALSLVCT